MSTLAAGINIGFVFFSENKAQWAASDRNSEISVIRILTKLGVPCVARSAGMGKSHTHFSAKM
jgi:hypothetical protein